VGKFFKVVVTATDGTLSTSAVTSGATAAVSNVNDAPVAGTVSITGAAAEGGTLTASLTGFSDADGDTLSYTYQWQIADTASGTYTNIANATSATYAIAGDQSQVGKFFKVVVTATDGTLSTSAVTSGATAAVLDIPEEMTDAPNVPARTNLLPQSAAIGGTGWNSYYGVDELSNAAIAPDGSRTADALYGTTGGNDGAAGQSIYYDLGNTTTVVAGSTYTFSVYAKAGTMSTLRMAYDSNVHNQHEFADVVFDLTRVSNASGAGSVANTTWRQEVVGDGWHRLSLTMTAASAQQYLALGFGVVPSGTGLDPATNVFVWGAQLEAANAATAYIPTSNSSATTDTTVTAAELANGFTLTVNASMAQAGDKVEVGYLNNGTFTSFATPEYSAVLLAPQAQLVIGVQSDTRLVAQDGTYALATRLVDANGFTGAASPAGTSITFETAVGGTTTAPVFSGFTNLLPNSEAIGQTGWNSYYGIDDTANAIAAPDGTMSADSLFAMAGGGATGSALYYDLGAGAVLQSGQTYTFSVYAKAGGVDKARLAFGSTVTNGVGFDLGTGLDASGTDWNQTYVGDGWYRLSVTKTLTANQQYMAIGFGSDQTAGAGNNIYVWGAQIETGTKASTYVPTQATSASSDTTITATELGLGVTVLVDASNAKAGDKVELGYLSNGQFTSFTTPEYSDVLSGAQTQVAILLDDPIAAGNYELVSRLVSPLDNLFGAHSQVVNSNLAAGDIIKLNGNVQPKFNDLPGDNLYVLPQSSGVEIQFMPVLNDETGGAGNNKISTMQSNLKLDFSRLLINGEVGALLQEDIFTVRDANGFIKMLTNGGMSQIYIDRDGAAGLEFNYAKIVEMPIETGDNSQFLAQILGQSTSLKFDVKFNLIKTSTSPFALEVYIAGLDEQPDLFSQIDVQGADLAVTGWKKIAADRYVIDLENPTSARQIFASAGGQSFKFDIPQGWYWKNEKASDLVLEELNGVNFVYGNLDIIAEIKNSHYYDGFNAPKAVWEWLLNQRYHNSPIYTTFEDRVAYSLINSFGFGLCDDVNTVYVSLMKSLNLDARLALYPRHTLGEVFFQGRWQVFDADTAAVYLDQYGIPIGLDQLEGNLHENYNDRLLGTVYEKSRNEALNLGWYNAVGDLPFMGSLSSFSNDAAFEANFLTLFEDTPRFLDNGYFPTPIETIKRIKLPPKAWMELIPSSEGKSFDLKNNTGETVPEVMFLKVYFDALGNYEFDYPLVPVAIEGIGTVEILGDSGGTYQIGSDELNDKLNNYYVNSSKITVHTLSGLNSITYLINPLRFYPKDNFTYVVETDAGQQTLTSANEGMVVIGGSQERIKYHNPTDQILSPKIIKTWNDGDRIFIEFNEAISNESEIYKGLFQVRQNGISQSISHIAIQDNVVAIELFNPSLTSGTLAVSYADLTLGTDDSAYVLQSTSGIDVKSFNVQFSAGDVKNSLLNSEEEPVPHFANLVRAADGYFETVNRQNLVLQLDFDVPLPGRKIEFWIDHLQDGDEANDYKLINYLGWNSVEIGIEAISNKFEFYDSNRNYQYPVAKYRAEAHVDFNVSGSYKVYARLVDQNENSTRIGGVADLNINDEVIGESFKIENSGTEMQPLTEIIKGKATVGTDVLVWVDENMNKIVDVAETILGISRTNNTGDWYVPIDVLPVGETANIRAMAAPIYDRQTLNNIEHASFSAGAGLTDVFSIYKSEILP
jgi:hypothetical protein